MTRSALKLSALLTIVVLGARVPAVAQGFLAPIGHAADVTATPSGFEIRFPANAEWPNAEWSAPSTQPWDWRGKAILAFDVANPGTESAEFSLRIDDDAAADGVHHCRTASATLGPHASGAFCVPLESTDPMSTLGMRGAPPLLSTTGLNRLSGSGVIDAGHIVAFQFFMHRTPMSRTLRFSRLRLLPSRSASEGAVGIVDAFGQFTGADWPDKAHAITDLTQSRAAEAAALAAFPVPAGRDVFGGWSGGPRLPTPGYFSTTKRDGRWWLVTPAGHLFLSFGIDAIRDSSATVVHPRDALFTGLPAPGDPLAKHYGTDGHILYGPYTSGRTFDFYGANLERKYGPGYQTLWRDRTLDRLRSWGFNTIGNWSDVALGALKRVPYTATLSVGGGHARLASGSDYWGQMHDPFDPQFAADCDAGFRDEAERVKDDPWCLGYFVDNELSWSGGPVEGGRYGLAYGALAADAAQPAKRAFLAQLQTRYGDISGFNRAWNMSLPDWHTLDAPYQASQTPTDAQKRDMGLFVYALAARYFTVVHDTLRKYDAHHLYLGCRFAEGSPPEAVRAAGEHCDVVSFNVYRPRLDSDELQKKWGWASALDRPCLIGEFHFGALDRGLFHPGLVAAPDQSGRAAMFSRYVESIVDNPAFVGAHWFEYGDEPLTGRSLDGENYNIGFVSITDTPYPEMVRAARLVLSGAYGRRAGHPAAHQGQSVRKQVPAIEQR